MTKQRADHSAVMRSYINLLNAKDWQGIVSLYADDAMIEDPVGGGQVLKGKAEIEGMYKIAVEMVSMLEQTGPVCRSHGNSCAMPFTIHLHMNGKKARINVIEIMTFNEDGKIIDMKAYWGPEDLTYVDQAD